MPIVRFRSLGSLTSWQPVAVEALLRGQVGSVAVSPQRLFGLARALGCERDLELACIFRALSQHVIMAGTELLFVNISMETFVDSRLESLLTAFAARYSPARVVLELLEGGRVDQLLLQGCMARFTKMGYLLAIDDIFGPGSSLQRARSLGRVDFFKTDRGFLSRLQAPDPSAAFAELESLLSLARERETRVVMEGIEEAQLPLLAQLAARGVTHGQGYLFGKAEPLPLVEQLQRSGPWLAGWTGGAPFLPGYSDEEEGLGGMARA